MMLCICYHVPKILISASLLSRCWRPRTKIRTKKWVTCRKCDYFDIYMYGLGCMHDAKFLVRFLLYSSLLSNYFYHIL